MSGCAYCQSSCSGSEQALVQLSFFSNDSQAHTTSPGYDLACKPVFFGTTANSAEPNAALPVTSEHVLGADASQIPSNAQHKGWESLDSSMTLQPHLHKVCKQVHSHCNTQCSKLARSTARKTTPALLRPLGTSECCLPAVGLSLFHFQGFRGLALLSGASFASVIGLRRALARAT